MYRILHIPTSTFLYTKKQYIKDLEHNMLRIVWAYNELANLSRSIQSEMEIIALSTKLKCHFILNNLHEFNFYDDELYHNLLNYEIIEC